jgi:hypothetical protein
MNIFGKEVSLLGAKKDKTFEDNGTFFYSFDQAASYQVGNSNDINRLKAFCTIPEVNAILNLRARAHGNFKIGAVDLKGNIIDDIEDPLADIIENPNYFQSKEEFFGQTNLFRDIFGNEFIHLTTPAGMKQPIGIFSLPSQNIEVKDNKSTNVNGGTGPFFLLRELPQNIEYWFKDTGGMSYKLRYNNLLHLNDNNVTFTDNTSFLKGMSKLDALAAPIENIKVAYEARNVIIVNRGAIGILSNASKDGIGSTAPMNIKEKERIQGEFRKYGLSKNQWQVIITNLALNWQQMAIDVDKLKLFDETREDTLKLCDAYGTPYELLASIRNTTFDNKKEAKRQWYRETIIPEANARIAGINRKYNTVERGFRFIPVFDHLPIFDTEKMERARSLYFMVNSLTKALEDEAIDIEQYKKELKKYGI